MVVSQGWGFSHLNMSDCSKRASGYRQVVWAPGTLGLETLSYNPGRASKLCRPQFPGSYWIF